MLALGQHLVPYTSLGTNKHSTLGDTLFSSCHLQRRGSELVEPSLLRGGDPRVRVSSG